MASPRRNRIIWSPKVGCKVEEAIEKLHWWRFILRIRKEKLCYGKDKILKYLAYGDCGISVTGDSYEQCFQRSATCNANIILPWSQRSVIFSDFCCHFSMILLSKIWYQALYHICLTNLARKMCRRQGIDHCHSVFFQHTRRGLGSAKEESSWWSRSSSQIFL